MRQNLAPKLAISITTTALAAVGLCQVNVLTYHNDLFRTGANTAETILRPSNVNSNAFGLLFNMPVDGQVYAQPLYLTNVNIPQRGNHAVLYVATEHNSVYAFDANSNQGLNVNPLWHVNLGPSVPNGDTGSGDINPEIGITSTPVISLTGSTAGTLYVVAKTKESDTHGNTIYVQRLHALDISNGSEKFGGPTVIQGTVSGNGDGTDGSGNVPFNPLIQHNRPGLLLLTNGQAQTLYIGYASHGDNGPYHGWLFAYNALTLQRTGILNTTPNAKTDPSGYPLAAGGVWQGGGALASDGSSIYFSTGNGTFDPSSQSFGDAVLKVNPTNGLRIVDWFAPSDQQSLDDTDADLGSGGVMLLPPSAGTLSLPALMVQSGKEGSIYLMNRYNLGRFSATSDNVVQELHQVMGGIWGSPAYFNGNVYYGPAGGSLLSFPVASAAFTGAGASSNSPEAYGYPGPTPSVSANGTTNGIVWAVETDAYGYGGPAVLRGYDAMNLQNELYNSSNTNGRDNLGPAVKFVTPTVVGGKVYVGLGNAVAVFGQGKWPATPQVSPAGGNYQNSVQVTATDSTPTAQIYYTTDGSDPNQDSIPYSGPITITSSTTLKFRAFAAGYGPSVPVERDYQINAILGHGSGLVGKYYNNSQNPTGPPTATRLDPTINFNWNGNSPINGVAGSNWAAEWKGYIQAEDNQIYTFSTISDDGVRVSVNGQLIINDWSYHGATLDQGQIQLQAGKYYVITVDYFQGGGGSVLQLFWQAPGMPYQIVPARQLYN